MKSIKFYLAIFGILFFINNIVTFGQYEYNHKQDDNSKKLSTNFSPSSVVVNNSANILSTNTLNFTVPAGNSRLLLVSVSDDNATDIVSVTFNGNPMIQIIERDDGTAVDSFWYLTLGNSAVGTTANIVAVSSGSTPNICSLISANSLVGVDQANPITDSDSAQAFAMNVSSTLNITSDSGDVVFDLFDGFTNTMGGTITRGTGQTQFFNHINLPATGGFAYYGSTYKPGTAGTTMSWTSTTEAMIHLAVNVNSLTPSAANVFISGRVLAATGSGLSNAFIQITKPDGSVQIARSNSFGYYKFEDLRAGETYILNVSKKGWSFVEPTRVINTDDNITDLNFIADQ